MNPLFHIQNQKYSIGISYPSNSSYKIYQSCSQLTQKSSKKLYYKKQIKNQHKQLNISETTNSQSIQNFQFQSLAPQKQTNLINYQLKMRKKSFSQNEKRQEKIEYLFNNKVKCFSSNSIQNSDFQQIKILGKGTSSKVSLVRHIKSNLILAIKTISKQYIKSLKIQQMVFREIKIQSFLNHKNLVKLYGFYSNQKNVHLLLEYCGNKTLYTFLKKNYQDKDLQQRKICFYIRQISKGIKQMHKNDIIHRDLKLQNILIQNDIIKICDFGSSAVSKNMKSSQIGSIPYLSPQQVKGQGYGKEKDLWSIGVIAFELFFKKIPFDEESILYIFMSKDKNIQFPQLKIPTYRKISDQAYNFLTRMLDKNPKKRLNMEQLLRHPFLNP